MTPGGPRTDRPRGPSVGPVPYCRGMPRRTATLLTSTLLLLAACASAVTAAPTATPTPAASVETPTPTPADPGRLVIGIDRISYEQGGDVDEFLFDSAEDAEDLLTLIEDLTGTAAKTEELEDTYGGYWGTGYTWAGLRINVGGGEAADRVSITASSPTLAEVALVTADGGLSVGSTRADAEAAGARDGYDSDGDGVSDWMDLGALEVPDTESLVNPGETGIMFVMLGLTDDAVDRIQSPGNDFSDI